MPTLLEAVLVSSQVFLSSKILIVCQMLEQILRTTPHTMHKPRLAMQNPHTTRILITRAIPLPTILTGPPALINLNATTPLTATDMAPTPYHPFKRVNHTMGTTKAQHV